MHSTSSPASISADLLPRFLCPLLRLCSAIMPHLPACHPVLTSFNAPASPPPLACFAPPRPVSPFLQVKALKEGKTVAKPIYNHVTGLLDPPEDTTSPNILIIEGLHPFYDDRVNELVDFRIYLDISDEIKFAWKIQRDMAERGHSLESIKASIEARKPDFDAYIDPQKKKADMIIQVG